MTLAQQIHLNTGNNEQHNHSIPISFKEAMNGPDAAGFMIAMNGETRTLIQMKAFINVSKEPSSVWVFKRRKLSDDSIRNLKVRICVKQSTMNLILNFVNHSIVILILKQIISEYRSTFQLFTQLLQIHLYHALHYRT